MKIPLQRSLTAIGIVSLLLGVAGSAHASLVTIPEAFVARAIQSLAPSSEVAPSVGSAVSAAAAEPEAASADWRDIKDLSYDMRAQFFVGLKRLESKVDGQIGELQAKRAGMKGTTDTSEWDFAMKEMNDARTFLKSVGEELNKASPVTWDQQKESVGRAWVRTQEAYKKVKSSTTS